MKLCLPDDQVHQIQRQDYEYQHYLEKRQEEEDILSKLNMIKGRPYNPYKDHKSEEFLNEKLKRTQRTSNQENSEQIAHEVKILTESQKKEKRLKIKNFIDTYGKDAQSELEDQHCTRDGHNLHKESYINRHMKECSFNPEINQKSRKLAKSIPPIYERVNTDASELCENGHFSSSKYNYESSHNLGDS